MGQTKLAKRLWSEAAKSLLLLGLVIGVSLSSQAQLEKDFCAEYVGTVEKNITIGMMLHNTAGGIGGTYFYRSDLRDIQVQGRYTANRDIVLQDVSGNAFHLRFVEDDPRVKLAGPRPLTDDVLEGWYMARDNIRHQQVLLEMDHGAPGACYPLYRFAGDNRDALIERNAQAFFSAVMRDDKATVAGLIAYPLTFNLLGRRMSVKGRAAFLRYYDAIFTKEFVAKITAGIPHHMFSNSEGAMISGGAVWFDHTGRAQAFNN
jgi:hypothetical protein